MAITRKQQRADGYIAQLKQEGIKHLVGSPQSGLSIQAGYWTVAGTTSEAITFTSVPSLTGGYLTPMETSTYIALIEGPVGDENPASKTTTGLTIESGTSMNGLTVLILLIGQTAGSYA